MKKYKVSQGLMNEIDEWRDGVDGLVISTDLMVSGFVLTDDVKDWWLKGDVYVSEKNNRLIALIQYVNGEDVFEVEKPKKWVVRSKNVDEDGYHLYIELLDNQGGRLSKAYGQARLPLLGDNEKEAFKFDSKEEAEKWANPLMEAVEAEDL